MTRDLFVHLLPQLVDPSSLRGSVAVVIDILRASTTILHALAAGAEKIIPCLEVDEALELAAGMDRERLLLGGERHGKLIPGFDLDNSPLSFTEEKVHGKSILFTTTNGTRALRQASQADRVLIGSFANLNAVLHVLLEDERPVHLVCAGTDGEITAEDVLFAGAIGAALLTQTDVEFELSDAALIAAGFYANSSDSQSTFETYLQAGLGGRNLLQLGFVADVRLAAEWDLFLTVPEYDARANEIRPGSSVDFIPIWPAPPGDQ